jgi:sugar O-acyltransferase (sialic acid O-acetyltransferase NeuD family)
MIPLILFGATAFPEIKQVISDINASRDTFSIRGILDDNEKLFKTEVGGVPVLGKLEEAHHFSDCSFVMAIGSYRSRLVRAQILQRLSLPPERFPSLIHPLAKIYETARIGYGCIVYPGVVIFAKSTIGNFVIILPNTVVGVENTVEEGALITSLVSTTSGVRIGAYAHLGTACCVAEGIHIGRGAQVGMGSVVLRDVPDGGFCLGNPARIIQQDTLPPELLKRGDASAGQ